MQINSDGTKEERWQGKVDNIILLIARLGWSTVQQVNYFLCQSKRDWPGKMVSQGWILSKIIAVDGKAMNILVLSYKGHKRAKSKDENLGKRIDKEASRQVRHDFIAAWCALHVIRKNHSLNSNRFDLKIWTERLLKETEPNSSGWPDICVSHQDRKLFHIEVERTRKTKPVEHFLFLKKLEGYERQNIKTIVVFEMFSQAQKFVDQLKVAANFGIEQWARDIYTKEYKRVSGVDREIFKLNLTIMIWDHKLREISRTFRHIDNSD